MSQHTRAATAETAANRKAQQHQQGDNSDEVAAITRLTKTSRASRHTRSVSWTNTSLPPMMFEDARSGSGGTDTTSPNNKKNEKKGHSKVKGKGKGQGSSLKDASAPPPQIRVTTPIPEVVDDHTTDDDAKAVIAELQQPAVHRSPDDVHIAARERSNSDTWLLARARRQASKDHNKALAYWRLEKEYRLVKDKLVAKAEECDSLAQYKEQLTREMDDLTESLFEEAHKMVRTAKEEAVRAEKRHIEAASKVEMLTAEVSALKTIVEHQRDQLQSAQPKQVSRPGSRTRTASQMQQQQQQQQGKEEDRQLSSSPPRGRRQSGRGFRRHFFRRQNSTSHLKTASKANAPSPTPSAQSAVTLPPPLLQPTQGDAGGGGTSSGGGDVKKSKQRSLSTQSEQGDDCGDGGDGTHVSTRTSSTASRTELSRAHSTASQDDAAATRSSGGTGHSGGRGGGGDDDDDDGEIVDPRLLEEFTAWYQSPDLSASFISSLEEGEMKRTLDVCSPSSPIRRQDIIDAIKENSLVIERLGNSVDDGRACSLTGHKPPTHRIRLGQKTDWLDVCETVRDRIASVCDCYVYLRYINLGLVKVSAKKAFLKLATHRQQMMNALLGLRLYESVL
ncbi:hypothetical protein PTSG_12304 [Salpingoeca rosetta]|uniref:GDP/GTP exchange factor Sec2 N-terminal domain-containing protein n=1 Tax=Salpingoeca rosetta (strain ATCC 50818 / BSB-021) TaxID=946362 RepID=F2UA88_SALR5|nr:uncharacterized protein PTSG_12304 [Salpingoeca rosetta]EGD73663.1 hypothetical protein PTSG_12304 [Salpingoeca rosetta]|eukprot:XP_004993944.1 hypothetical protein PTSG_12304 [Salpingoeca rosetta]